MLRAIFGGEENKLSDNPKTPEQIGGLFDSMMGGKPNPAKRNRTKKKDVTQKRG